MTKQTHSFQAEVKQLLHLVTHALYSNKEIFLRELISNASDACDKLRFEALDHSALYEDAPNLDVRVLVDKANRTITIRDNGSTIQMRCARNLRRGRARPTCSDDAVVTMWSAAVEPVWSIDAFREAARAALRAEVAPEHLDWDAGAQHSLLALPDVREAPALRASPRVPSAFVELRDASEVLGRSARILREGSAETASSGNTPDTVDPLQGLVDTAEKHARTLLGQEKLLTQVGLSLLADIAGGTDLGAYPLDGPLPDLPQL